MNSMQINSSAGPRRALGLFIAFACLALALGLPCALAQTAAQAAALAHLGRRRLSALPQYTAPNGIGATNVSLDLPRGIAFDAAGNLYIADTDDNVVLEVDLAGVVTTVAGTGEQGFSGDGGAAASAQLDSPAGVAVDSGGNVYIADTHNQRIRKVSSGAITTICGTGVAGYSGDGGSATAATLSLPSAIAVDSAGNLYVADTNNHRIRKITGTTITTVAGDGEQTYSGDGGPATAAGLDSPSGIAVDAAFNIYIGDTHNQRVRMVTAATGNISTLAGTGTKGFNTDGAAATAALARPSGVAVDSTGTVYVADSDNNRIRAISGGNISTIAGNGSEGFGGDTGVSTSATLDTPRSVAVQGASVAIADTENQRIREVTDGTINTVSGQPGSGAESLAISGPLTTVYGTGTLAATFSNGSNIATGLVTFYDDSGATPVVIGTASLSSNTAVISTAQLSAGTHSIVAAYAGSTNNPAITSGVYVLPITPLQLTAVANAVNMLYGQAVPALSGTLNGVLSQDAGNVTALFATTATMTSPVGIYPITVALSGPAQSNYTVVLGGASGSVQIAQAPSSTALTASSPAPVFGAAITLKATVASTTSGTPSGSVTFSDGATQLSNVPLTAGVATLTTTTLPLGAQSITATYSGDMDFVGSTSSALAENVIQPDFTVTASPTSQTILPGATATYRLALTPANPTFVDPVSLSAGGLPPGATATFAPASIAAGAGASTVTLTIAANRTARLNKDARSLANPAALALLLVPFTFTRRARRCAARLARSGRVMLALLLLGVLSTLSGCGGGGFFTHSTHTYTVTITAVSGSITHTTSVTLTVQ